jgi:hypothetical protein
MATYAESYTWKLGAICFHYIKRVEVIDFRLFRATELAFAIRPKDGVARQGRRGGFHCYCPKSCWNNFSVVVRIRGRSTGLVFASCPKDCFARQGRRCDFQFYRFLASSSFGCRTLCFRYPSELPLCVRAFGPFTFVLLTDSGLSLLAQSLPSKAYFYRFWLYGFPYFYFSAGLGSFLRCLSCCSTVSNSSFARRSLLLTRLRCALCFSL